jgi:pimeloyl-ACP methyl ester carboxylesterase
MVCDGLTHGENELKLARLFHLLAALTLPGVLFVCDSSAQNAPPADAFQVLRQVPTGPRITPYLQYQLDQAWRQDEARQRNWESIQSEQDLLKMQASVRQSLLQMIGGLPGQKTKLNPRITGKIQMDGYSIEKLIFESLPGVFVTALVYVPDDHSQKHPAVLVPAGHATNGKIHYQALCQRLAARGYVVIAWDPVGQGERSQFWDAKSNKSRYNLVCAEHAVLGNLAYLAGANLARWEIWDGMRAVDYLLTRPEVDGERISITGTSGGGTQTALIAALDPRIKVAVPSCYISSLPMRMGNRIFADPDSDPEQDLFGMSSSGIGHPGLLLLMYPRPVMVASAVLDFFPIEGARKSFRETQRLYEHFGYANRIAMTEGYHAHQYSDENQEAALDFLDRFNGMPIRHGLAVPRLLADKDLLCTRSGQLMVDQSDARSLAEVIREYYEERKSQPAVRLLKEYYEGRALHVENSKLEMFNGVPPGEDQILWEFISSSNAGDIQIDKYVLRHSRLLEMPLLYIHKGSTASQKTILWFSETGKATRADWPELEKLLQSGHNVVTFDFRGLGETRMPYTAVSPDDPTLGKLDFDRAYANSISGVLANYVYNSLLMGRPYFFQMIEDSQIASRFATERLGAKFIAVTAPGDAYTLASAVAEIFPELKLLPQPNVTALKWSEIVEKKQEIWPIQYLVPSGAYIH